MDPLTAKLTMLYEELAELENELPNRSQVFTDQQEPFVNMAESAHRATKHPANSRLGFEDGPHRSPLPFKCNPVVLVLLFSVIVGHPAVSSAAGLTCALGVIFAVNHEEALASLLRNYGPTMLAAIREKGPILLEFVCKTGSTLISFAREHGSVAKEMYLSQQAVLLPLIVKTARATPKSLEGIMKDCHAHLIQPIFKFTRLLCICIADIYNDFFTYFAGILKLHRHSQKIVDAYLDLFRRAHSEDLENRKSTQKQPWDEFLAAAWSCRIPMDSPWIWAAYIASIALAMYDSNIHMMAATTHVIMACFWFQFIRFVLSVFLIYSTSRMVKPEWEEALWKEAEEKFPFMPNDEDQGDSEEEEEDLAADTREFYIKKDVTKDNREQDEENSEAVEAAKTLVCKRCTRPSDRCACEKTGQQNVEKDQILPQTQTGAQLGIVKKPHQMCSYLHQKYKTQKYKTWAESVTDDDDSSQMDSGEDNQVEQGNSQGGDEESEESHREDEERYNEDEQAEEQNENYSEQDDDSNEKDDEEDSEEDEDDSEEDEDDSEEDEDDSEEDEDEDEEEDEEENSDSEEEDSSEASLTTDECRLLDGMDCQNIDCPIKPFMHTPGVDCETKPRVPEIVVNSPTSPAQVDRPQEPPSRTICYCSSKPLSHPPDANCKPEGPHTRIVLKTPASPLRSDPPRETRLREVCYCSLYPIAHTPTGNCGTKPWRGRVVVNLPPQPFRPSSRPSASLCANRDCPMPNLVHRPGIDCRFRPLEHANRPAPLQKIPEWESDTILEPSEAELERYLPRSLMKLMDKTAVLAPLNPSHVQAEPVKDIKQDNTEVADMSSPSLILPKPDVASTERKPIDLEHESLYLSPRDLDTLKEAVAKPASAIQPAGRLSLAQRRRAALQSTQQQRPSFGAFWGQWPQQMKLDAQATPKSAGDILAEVAGQDYHQDMFDISQRRSQSRLMAALHQRMEDRAREARAQESMKTTAGQMAEAALAREPSPFSDFGLTNVSIGSSNGSSRFGEEDWMEARDHA